ncbi:MAG TPA: 50S ribosomal protein L25 [Candidatus Paceibacterota bacterium]|nr:50S ribosomal protein L25 [Candidatus Paceibacterota bacterium]
MLTLEVKRRETIGKAGKRMPDTVMPAVYYGHKEASTPIELSKGLFKKAWREAGESSVVILKDGDRELETLIHAVDVDPIKGEPRHADFYVLEKGKKVQVAVPIHFEGVPEAVKNLGGILVKVLHELEVEAMPKDLPHALTVDVTPLSTFESQILVKDIALPAGVVAMAGAEDVVAAITEPHEEKVEETPMSLEDIEVEKKGKKEEEGEAGAAEEGEKDDK